MDSVGEGEGGMIWENGIETCIISHMKRVVSPGSMHDTGCLGRVHWDDPEGWYGEGGGRRVQDGEHIYLWRIHFDIWQNQYNIVKLKNKIKLKKKNTHTYTASMKYELSFPENSSFVHSCPPHPSRPLHCGQSPTPGGSQCIAWMSWHSRPGWYLLQICGH